MSRRKVSDNMTAEQLEELIPDADIGLLVYVAGHGNATTTILEKLVDENIDDVSATVATRKDVSPELLEKVFNQYPEWEELQYILVSNPNTSNNLLKKVFNSDTYAAWTLVRNPNLPENMLWLLTENKVTMVRKRAALELSKRESSIAYGWPEEWIEGHSNLVNSK